MRTQSFVAVLLASLMVVPAGAAEPLVNQIDNGGFEEFEDGEPTEWRILRGEVEPAGTVAEGDDAVRLLSDGEIEATTIGQNVSLEREDVPTVPNGTYDLDFAALFDSGQDTEPTTSPEARAYVLWKNALGEVTETDVIPIAESNTYQAYNVTLDAPIDAVEAEVQFEVVRDQPTDRTDGHLNVDDVAFGPALPA